MGLLCIKKKELFVCEYWVGITFWCKCVHDECLVQIKIIGMLSYSHPCLCHGYVFLRFFYPFLVHAKVTPVAFFVHRGVHRLFLVDPYRSLAYGCDI